MTTKHFINKATKLIEAGEFVSYDYRDTNMNLNPDEILVCGKDEKETFLLTVLKVVA